MTAAKRRAARRFGLRAERLAGLWLRLRLYRILATRYAGGGGEIDLVAMRGRTVAFVEVKARGLIEDAAIAVTATKRRRIGRAARHWLARNPWAAAMVLRGDAVFLAPRRLPRHIVDAFEIGFD